MITNYTIAYPPIKTNVISHTENTHTLTIEPLLPGFGHTLGNSLRRVFLSSIPGYAVAKIRINDITHEYQAIEGVVEDVMDIVLNLKLLRTRILTDDEMVTLTLDVSTAGDILAKNFDKNAKVEIANPDLCICHLNKDSALHIEVDIQKGHGYLSVDDIDLSATTNPKDIVVDAVFTPVTNVSFNVEKTRVGDKTNFDKIIINFETDGTIKPQDATEYALEMVAKLFANIRSSYDASEEFKSYTSSEKTQTADVDVVTTESLDKSGKATVDGSIDLPSRIKTQLEKNGITTNRQLIDMVDKLESLSGVGAASLTTIQEYLKTIS